MDNLFAKFQQNKQKIQQKNLLQKQQTTTDKLTALLATSAERLTCGPTCQKIKTSEQLKQKYLNAQTNIQTAPIVLEESKKNYYVYTESQPYYDNMVETELKNKATTMATLIGDSFNEEVSNAETMNSYYNTALINSSYTKELLTDYTNKNIELKGQLKDRHGDILTNDRKTYYETEALARLTLWYRFWWYIYYILFIVVVIITILRKPWNSIGKIIINLVTIIVYLFLPYIIHFITGFLYNLYIKIKNMMPINVYNNL
jgi:hypothetical protein